jgi:DNA-binding CsgD family transcriptional regulator/energy-coupling factor transporter ATP-binding protein EcfA2
VRRSETGLVGRAGLLDLIDSHLSENQHVVLCGPSGIGKSAVLDAIAATAAGRGGKVLRTAPGAGDHRLPFAGLADLFAGVSARRLAELPGPQRAALDAALLRRDLGEAGPGQIALRLAVRAVLERCGASAPVLLVLDDVQWLDPPTAEVLRYVLRRLRGVPVRAAIAERVEHGGASGPGTTLCPPGTPELTVPPLAPEDVVELAGAHGLPARTAARLHADSGGNPYLALTLCRELAGHRLAPWHSVPLPDRVRVVLRRRVAELPPPVRRTLLAAALAGRPTVPLLRRAGHPDAERDLRLAAASGVVRLIGEAVRFTPGSIAAVLVDDAAADERADVHRRLSTVVSDPVELVRHRAMATGGLGGVASGALAAAAGSAHARGARQLAAELYLLAAERTPAGNGDERVERLLRATEAAATAGRADLVDRAAEAVLATVRRPAARVRARIAQVDAANQALGHMAETLALARAEAGEDPALLAPVQLRLAWQALLADGSAHAAHEEASRAAASAHRAGDTTVESMALTMRAQMERALGRPEAEITLRSALDIDAPPPSGWLFLSPRFVGARHAYFDDRLDRARRDLLGLLSVAERAGGEETIEVLRGLAEVSARAGHCREALDQAGRAMRLSDELGMSPGKCWYTAAIAELAGGSFARALGYAERSVRASIEERDVLFLSRGCYAVGLARLYSGDPAGAVTALLRVRDLEAAQGTADPSVLRWHAELASALAAVGEDEQGLTVVERARGDAERLGRRGVLAQLIRGEATCRAAAGDAVAASDMLAASAATLAEIGLPIEHGYTLLTLARIERRRRRYAASRAALRDALAVFTRVGARPWIEEAGRALSNLDSTAEPLTATEGRIAALVGEGASNREIAARLYLSVKTVEATLTRIYRKLDVRSRTQLSLRLRSG